MHLNAENRKSADEEAVRASTSTRGCVPSDRYRCACFISSPMSSTVEEVPSLRAGKVQSSCS